MKICSIVLIIFSTGIFAEADPLLLNQMEPYLNRSHVFSGRIMRERELRKGKANILSEKKSLLLASAEEDVRKKTAEPNVSEEEIEIFRSKQKYELDNELSLLEQKIDRIIDRERMQVLEDENGEYYSSSANSLKIEYLKTFQAAKQTDLAFQEKAEEVEHKEEFLRNGIRLQLESLKILFQDNSRLFDEEDPGMIGANEDIENLLGLILEKKPLSELSEKYQNILQRHRTMAQDKYDYYFSQIYTHHSESDHAIIGDAGQTINGDLMIGMMTDFINGKRKDEEKMQSFLQGLYGGSKQVVNVNFASMDYCGQSSAGHYNPFAPISVIIQSNGGCYSAENHEAFTFLRRVCILGLGCAQESPYEQSLRVNLQFDLYDKNAEENASTYKNHLDSVDGAVHSFEVLHDGLELYENEKAVFLEARENWSEVSEKLKASAYEAFSYGLKDLSKKYASYLDKKESGLRKKKIENTRIENQKQAEADEIKNNLSAMFKSGFTVKFASLVNADRNIFSKLSGRNNNRVFQGNPSSILDKISNEASIWIQKANLNTETLAGLTDQITRSADLMFQSVYLSSVEKRMELMRKDILDSTKKDLENAGYESVVIDAEGNVSGRRKIASGHAVLRGGDGTREDQYEKEKKDQILIIHSPAKILISMKDIKSDVQANLNRMNDSFYSVLSGQKSMTESQFRFADHTEAACEQAFYRHRSELIASANERKNMIQSIAQSMYGGMKAPAALQSYAENTVRSRTTSAVAKNLGISDEWYGVLSGVMQGGMDFNSAFHSAIEDKMWEFADQITGMSGLGSQLRGKIESSRQMKKAKRQATQQLAETAGGIALSIALPGVGTGIFMGYMASKQAYQGSLEGGTKGALAGGLSGAANAYLQNTGLNVGVNYSFKGGVTGNVGYGFGEGMKLGGSLSFSQKEGITGGSLNLGMQTSAAGLNSGLAFSRDGKFSGGSIGGTVSNSSADMNGAVKFSSKGNYDGISLGISHKKEVSMGKYGQNLTANSGISLNYRASGRLNGISISEGIEAKNQFGYGINRAGADTFVNLAFEKGRLVSSEQDIKMNFGYQSKEQASSAINKEILKITADGITEEELKDLEDLSVSASQIDPTHAKLKRAISNLRSGLENDRIDPRRAEELLENPKKLLDPDVGKSLEIAAHGNNEKSRIGITDRLLGSIKDSALSAVGIYSDENGTVDSEGNWNPNTCFTAGTFVRTAPGTSDSILKNGNYYKKIESIQIGDIVASADQDTGKIGFRRVTQTFIHRTRNIYRIRFENGFQLETTWNHPFYKENSGWVKAENLKAEDRLLDHTGVIEQLNQKKPDHSGGVKILSIEIDDRIDTVYNLEVEDFHTYFVTEGNIWVHNYIVKRGDSLTKIARKFKTAENDLTVQKLKEMNGLNNDRIIIGQNLKVEEGNDFVNNITNKAKSVWQKYGVDGYYWEDRKMPSEMSLSPKGKEFLGNHEGVCYGMHITSICKTGGVYTDSGGLPTKGVGILVRNESFNSIEEYKQKYPEEYNSALNSVYTKAKALDLFDQKAKEYIEAVKQKVTTPLTQNEFDALVGLTYNIGKYSGLSNFIRDTELNKGIDSKKIYQSLSEKTYNNRREQDVGLIKRRIEEFHLFQSGEYDYNAAHTAEMKQWCVRKGVDHANCNAR